MGSLHGIQGCLVDLDGTLVRGRQMLPGANVFLESLEGRFVIVSNDAEHTPLELSRGLKRLGLTIAPHRIVLAGATALDEIARWRPRARIAMMASKSLMIHARALGLVPVQERPDVVFLGRDRHFSYERLMVAANAVRCGAELVVANPDLVHPGPHGAVVPETGALLAALLACTGPVPCRIIGKPEAALFEAGLALLALSRNAVLMVGDNPATDGEGARRLGLRYFELRDGVFPEISARAPCRDPAGMLALSA
ncbi:HAD-IIA family hydrolase [Bosea sp. BIWAKO-01]|uniref:HAD-IIA family hydrolase n=1 Tax=Bosea sp. BIWAKO-01 TaxID=506668 RepID=UPI0008537223|nr:HAD hydrolase-like protein [Bosea sp. BIWAKO-01]GAU86440.1 4-nitrophenylphosphatase [Bosea sp. BIWAKO-01]